MKSRVRGDWSANGDGDGDSGGDNGALKKAVLRAVLVVVMKRGPGVKVRAVDQELYPQPTHTILLRVDRSEVPRASEVHRYLAW